MGFSQIAKDTNLGQSHLAYRPSQTYNLAGSPYTLWTILGGPIEIISLVGMITGAIVAATTVNITVSGVAEDNGAAIVGGGALGNVIIFPLNAAAVITVAGAIPTTVALIDVGKMFAGTGTGAIAMVLGGAAGSGVLSISMVYRKLSPLSRVV